MAVPFLALKSMVTVFVLVLGNLSPVDPVDPITVATIAGTVVSAGTSVAQTANALHQRNFIVTCKIEVENWTRYPLVIPVVRIKGGALVTAPTSILPTKKEAFAARKTSGTATGSYGTASWEMRGVNRRFVLMWSTPYSYDFHSNWMGIGMTRYGLTSVPQGHAWFDQMYYRESSNNLNFIRKRYYHLTDPIIFRNDKFEIEAIMTNIHKAEIKVVVRPLRNNPRDLAAPIRKMLEHMQRKRKQLNE